MPISMLCPGCNGKLFVGDTAAGKTVTCPRCRGKMIVPTPEPDFEVVDDEFEVVEDEPLRAKRFVKKDNDDDRPKRKLVICRECGEENRAGAFRCECGAKLGQRRKRRRMKEAEPQHTGFFATESWILGGGVLGGLVAMLIAVVWFILGLMNDWIFYYPPILFVVGLVGVIRGLAGDD